MKYLRIGLTIFSIVLFVGEVSAECAWVVWTKTEVMGNDPIVKTEPWSPGKAFETKAACEEVRWVEFKFTEKMYKSFINMEPPEEGEKVFVHDDNERLSIYRANPKSAIEYTARCYPDKIDPRGK